MVSAYYALPEKHRSPQCFFATFGQVTREGHKTTNCPCCKQIRLQTLSWEKNKQIRLINPWANVCQMFVNIPQIFSLLCDSSPSRGCQLSQLLQLTSCFAQRWHFWWRRKTIWQEIVKIIKQDKTVLSLFWRRYSWLVTWPPLHCTTTGADWLAKPLHHTTVSSMTSTAGMKL